ncbi:MAG: 2TM domain-containing protein [Chitinophagales bacterium]
MENRDEKLWQLATQRAKFKGKVITYFAVNIFLWAIWFFTRDHHHDEFIPWPAWASLGWGFGLIINYVRLYHTQSEDQIQKEYDKLTNKQ